MNDVESERKTMTRLFGQRNPESYYRTRRERDARIAVDEVERRNIDGKYILEIGAGCGYLSWLCGGRGAFVVATDIYGDQLPAEPDTVAAIADNARLPFLDSSFDCVFCDNVIHHGDLASTVSEARRVLRDDGVFVSVCEPCISTDESESDVLARDCSAELAIGIDEHRPNYRQYSDTFLEHFRSVIIADGISGEYRGDCNYGDRGIMIHAAV